MGYEPPAPAIRRLLVDETTRALNATTQKDRRAHYAAMHAYARSLDILLRSDSGAEAGIAPGTGTTGDKRALDEVQRFLGEQTAGELGLGAP